MLALTGEGPGRPSTAAVVAPRLKGPRLAVLQLALGAAGSYLATSKLLNEALDENAARHPARRACLRTRLRRRRLR